MKKIKVMQGISLIVLILFIVIMVCYYEMLSSYREFNSIEEMNEIKLVLKLLKFVVGFFILYALVYANFYIRLLQGKQTYNFHRINVYFTGSIPLITLFLLIIFKKPYIIFIEPIVLPLLFLFFNSIKYIKYHSKSLKKS